MPLLLFGRLRAQTIATLVALGTTLSYGNPALAASSLQQDRVPPQRTQGVEERILEIEATCPLSAESREHLLRMWSQGMRTRAEVRAETELWRRTGMAELHRGRQRPDPYSVKYQERYAEYRRLRNGPAFVQELCRQLS